MSTSYSSPGAAGLPGRPADGKQDSYPRRWRGSHFLSLNLGDPGDFFPVAARIFGPYLRLAWLCIPIALMGFAVMFRHSFEMQSDLARLAPRLGFWTSTAIGLFCTSVLAKFWEGVLMAHYGVPPAEWGFRLTWGIFPRFYVLRTPISALDFPLQRNCYLAPALFRLMLFAFGILMWSLTRRDGTGLSDLSLVLANAGLISWLFTSNPIWHADGYRVMAAQLRQPKLREHALYVIGCVLTFRRLPRELSAREFWGLLAWAALSAAFTAAFAYVIFVTMAQDLIQSYAGFGAVVMVLIVIVIFVYLREEGPASLSVKRNERKQKKYLEKMRQERDRVLKMAAILSDRDAARSEDVPKTTSDATSPDGERPSGPAPRPDETNQADPAAPQDGGPSGPPPPDGPQRPDRPAARPAAAAASDLDDILAMPVASTRGGTPSTEEVDSLLETVFGDSPVSGSGEPAAGLDDDEDPTSDLELADIWGEESILEPARPTSDATGTAPVPADNGADPARTGAARAEAGRPRKPGRRPANDPLADLDRLLQMGDSAPTPWQIRRRRLIQICILVILVLVAFLPYPYKVGGNFTIAPLTRSEARARIDGEIVAVNVKQGDWVKEGDVLAVLSDWNQTRDLAINQADDAKLQADLQTMLDGATPEEIGVARQEVATAEVAVRTTQQNLDRQEALYKSGTISKKVVEDARDAHDAAVAQRDAAQARLDLVSAPIRQTTIDAQRATINRNQADLAYARAMLDYTRIRAITSGQVVSDLTKLPVGAHLAVGGLFSQIEENRTVIASVDIPETAIDDVQVGADVELRLWSDPMHSVPGKVKFIAPTAEQRDYGWVIRVDVEVPNPDGRLQTNMTGFGKIRAADRPVWQAFSQTIIGFVKIELWSWIP